MSLLATLKELTPHLESQEPYGYRFEGIRVYRTSYKDVEEGRQDLDIYAELDETHDQQGDIKIGGDNPHTDRIVFEIASHIEGNFGPPYRAIIVVREEDGYITIHTPKGCRWWMYAGQWFRNYLMGLRSLLDLLK